MPRAFVTGWPIKHSKSPLLHGFWLNELGIDGSYEAVACEPEDFPDFLSKLGQSGFVGGNVTIPHKEVAFEQIPDRDEAAEAIGAVNTIWIEDGSLKASNTDAYGFSANLDDRCPRWRDQKTATVLGAGGASRAIIHALITAGYTTIHIANRTVSRAQKLADRFRAGTIAHPLDALDELLNDTDLFVNTSAIGMNGEASDQLPNLANLPRTAIVTDIVYNPLLTPILSEAQEQGLETVDGLGMLLHQAVPGFEKWFGKTPKVTQALRDHILEAS